jgi:N-acetylneuraminic acid mutarotase
LDKKANYPGGGGGGSSLGTCFAINGKGYICLGINNSLVYNQELWEYNPTTDTWSQKANFPGVARDNAKSFVIGDTAFVGTGTYGSGSDYQKDL